MFSGGLYAYVRHPRYAGMFSAVAGAAIARRNAHSVDCSRALVSFRAVVIRLEEKELSARFGPAYDDYRKRVPAFVPSIRKSPTRP